MLVVLDHSGKVLGRIRVVTTARQDAKKVGKGECTAYMDCKKMNFAEEACELKRLLGTFQDRDVTRSSHGKGKLPVSPSRIWKDHSTRNKLK